MPEAGATKGGVKTMTCPALSAFHMTCGMDGNSICFFFFFNHFPIHEKCYKQGGLKDGKMIMEGCV